MSAGGPAGTAESSGRVRRRRVLTVIRWPVGGIRTWCKYVYKAPHFSDFDIDVLVPASHEADILSDDLLRTGLRIRVIRTRASAGGFAISAIKTIAAGAYSLVHSHGFTSAAVSAMPVYLRRVPHLVTIHEEVLDDQYRDARGRLFRIAANRSLATADCIHAVSYSSCENLRNSFPGSRMSSGGIRVICNGIDSERFRSASGAAIRRSLGVADDTLLVGYFGRFMAAKGFRYLVDAVDKHRRDPNAAKTMMVMAVGSGGFRLEEEAIVRARGLGDSFIFLDFMPDIAEAIRAVDVVAMPSLWEASGLLAMETLTAGVPLVASDASGLKEVCLGTPAAVVPRRDVGALLDGLLSASSDESRKAAEAYGPIASTRFDAASARDQLAELYRALVRIPDSWL